MNFAIEEILEDKKQDVLSILRGQPRRVRKPAYLKSPAESIMPRRDQAGESERSEKPPLVKKSAN